MSPAFSHLPSVCRNFFKIAIETFLTLTRQSKRVSKGSDFVILRIPSLEWCYLSCLTKYWESLLCWIENKVPSKVAYLLMRWESVARDRCACWHLIDKSTARKDGTDDRHDDAEPRRRPSHENQSHRYDPLITLMVGDTSCPISRTFGTS